MGFILVLIVFWGVIGIIDLIFNDKDKAGFPTVMSLLILLIIWVIIMITKYDNTFKYENYSEYKKLQIIENDIIKIQDNTYVFKWNNNYHEINKEDINIKINKDSTYIELLYIISIQSKEKGFFHFKTVQDTSYSKNPKYILHKSFQDTIIYVKNPEYILNKKP